MKIKMHNFQNPSPKIISLSEGELEKETFRFGFQDSKFD